MAPRNEVGNGVDGNQGSRDEVSDCVLSQSWMKSAMNVRNIRRETYNRIKIGIERDV